MLRAHRSNPVRFNGAAAHEPRKAWVAQPLILHGFTPRFASVAQSAAPAILSPRATVIINAFPVITCGSASMPGHPHHHRHARKKSLVKEPCRDENVTPPPHSTSPDTRPPHPPALYSRETRQFCRVALKNPQNMAQSSPRQGGFPDKSGWGHPRPQRATARLLPRLGLRAALASNFREVDPAGLKAAKRFGQRLHAFQ